ncbi:RHS repeat protein [Xanthomonas citri pv. citri]|nr:RHS repeat protein [Xanthomonas citri pv. citri]
MKKVVSFVYDELGRATTTTYQDGNTITATYDAGNRLRKLVDTAAAGALSWDYDDYDAVIAASTPQGNVTYVYALVGRRKGNVGGGQPRVEYTYDTADLPRRIAQGTETCCLTTMMSIV